MKWQDLNTTPCGLLRQGQPMIIGAAGENQSPPFLWYWAGEMNIKPIPGGTLDPATGAITKQDGTVHGWVTPLTDMPEITDINQAMADHQAMSIQAASPDFQHYLREQIKMAVNGINAGDIK